ncbi:MAG TPA: adenylate/guanylate cyclase domain-containing protein [Candidatus Eisenbacteria bacterium]|nr:adenylate/guanylate cyclase domain-containing protein [Candidatus Eisenbacteria bacterium]
MKPDVRFARNGETAIGYALFGAGPDFVYLSPYNNLDIAFENRLFERFVQRLSSFARVIVIDRRGTGVSDRYSPEDLPPLEDLVDDVVAVLDEVESQRPVLFGFSDAGSLCAMFASTRPERVSGLILYATAARGTQAPDYPWQWTEEEWQSYLGRIRASWGTREYAAQSLPYVNPSLVGDERMLAWWERFQRLSASPSALSAQEQIFREIDIRGLLSAISVPTLVLHRTDDMIEPVGAGRFLGSEIPDAQYVELAGADHFPWVGDQQSVIAEVERFVGEIRSDERKTFDRFIATILFTDIVDSTAQAATVGDHGWREVRKRHERLTRGQLARFHGREVKALGDGYLAVFDGPARAVQCARVISESMSRHGVGIRAGIHTGEVEPDGDDISGLGVTIGARICALAAAGEVLVSSTVKDLVAGSGLAFEDRGVHKLKGVPDAWHLYAAINSP